jgi:hypothetical protein
MKRASRRPRRNPSESATLGVPDSVVERFSAGGCIPLALALHDRFGWPILAQISDVGTSHEHIAHAYVRDPMSAIEVDILGPQPDGVDLFSPEGTVEFPSRATFVSYVEKTSGRPYTAKSQQEGIAAANEAIDRYVLPKLMAAGMVVPSSVPNRPRRNPSPLDNPAFRRWFGDSKVVDERGEPLVVWHGTDKGFDVFDPARSGEHTSAGNTAMGFFFAEDYGLARDVYAGRRGVVMEVYLSIQKPLRIRDKYDNDMGAALRIAAQGYLGHNPESAEDWLSFREYLVDMRGIDGVEFTGYADDPRYEQRVFLAFSPTQIKSATDNVGTYDPDDPSILRNPEMQLADADGAVRLFVGDAADFADASDASVAMSSLEGVVAWIDWIESRRPGGGTRAMRKTLDQLRDRGVVAVGLQVVPADPTEENVERLSRWYARFGFEDASHLVPWSDFPVMLRFDEWSAPVSGNRRTSRRPKRTSRRSR